MRTEFAVVQPSPGLHAGQLWQSHLREDPETLLSTFEFAYPFPQATVTYTLADSTLWSILTYDFVCGP